MSKSTAEKIAIGFLRKYGMLDAKSSTFIAQQHAAGKIDNPTGYTDKEMKEGLSLVQVLSYHANPQAYESGDGKFVPETGKKLLEAPALLTPSVQKNIASMLGAEHPYSVSINTLHSAQIKGGAMQRSGEQENIQTTPPENKDPNYTLQPTATPGGYSRVASGVFQTEKKASPQGTTTMKADGRGGSYVGTLGSGDSRQNP